MYRVQFIHDSTHLFSLDVQNPKNKPADKMQKAKKKKGKTKRGKFRSFALSLVLTSDVIHLAYSLSQGMKLQTCAFKAAAVSVPTSMVL